MGPESSSPSGDVIARVRPERLRQVTSPPGSRTRRDGRRPVIRAQRDGDRGRGRLGTLLCTVGPGDRQPDEVDGNERDREQSGKNQQHRAVASSAALLAARHDPRKWDMSRRKYGAVPRAGQALAEESPPIDRYGEGASRHAQHRTTRQSRHRLHDGRQSQQPRQVMNPQVPPRDGGDRVDATGGQVEQAGGIAFHGGARGRLGTEPSGRPAAVVSGELPAPDGRVQRRPALDADPRRQGAR